MKKTIIYEAKLEVSEAKFYNFKLDVELKLGHAITDEELAEKYMDELMVLAEEDGYELTASVIINK